MKIQALIAIGLISSSNMHASGTAYRHSVECVMNVPFIKLDSAGKGYSDSQWCGENPPNSENEDGEATYEQNEDQNGPCYDYKTAQQVWEDDENYYILEDDGTITSIGKK